MDTRLKRIGDKLCFKSHDPAEGPLPKFHLAKCSRKTWWNSLTPKQQQDYIARKQAQKAQKRARTNYASTCPVYPTITDENRAQWQARIKAKNPWVKFQTEQLDEEIEFHLHSIKHEGCLI